MLNIKKLLLIPVVAIMCMFARIDSVFAVTVDGVDYVFSLTISSVPSSGTYEGKFQFRLSAKGTFYIDCGTDGTLSSDDSTANAMISGGTLNKTNTNLYIFQCTYPASSYDSEKTIRFGGRATAYGSTANTTTIDFYAGRIANSQLITSISGNLSQIFLYPGAATGYPRFHRTFYRAQITSIPPYLFSAISETSDSMFYQTFFACSKLSGFIPSTSFSGLIGNGSPTANNVWTNTFYGCNGLVSSCPTGYSQYTTGYESYWNNKVSCKEPINLNWYDGSTQLSGGASSCTLGGTFSLPPAPTTTRPGYVFAGWRQTCVSKIRNLDPIACGSTLLASGPYGYLSNIKSFGGLRDSNYGLTTLGQWAVETSYGTVWGMTKCSSEKGSYCVPSTPASSTGYHCWCQATGFSPAGSDYTQGPQCTTDASSLWVYYGNASACRYCAQYCAMGMISCKSAQFRATVLEAAGL